MNDQQIKTTILVNGYAYPTIDSTVLQQTLPYLTYLSIFSYHVTALGDLITIFDDTLIQTARNNSVAPMMVITNIDESGSFSSELAHSILNNESIQDRLLNTCLNIMQQKQYYGIDLDFEYIFPSDKEAYNNFLNKAVTLLHPYNFIVATALAPKVSGDQKGTLYEAHDYAFHGKTVDHVILMTYEWGYTYGPPQAVAPINQVQKVLDYAVSVIPSEKILMGIPNYGYDWTLPYEPGSAARSLSHTQAATLAQEKGATIQFDEVAQSPYFYYTSEDGKEHVVWFEDARSIEAKLNLVTKYQLGGVSYWTINSFFPDNWNVLEDKFRVQKIL